MIALLAFSAGFFFLETVLFPTSWSAKNCSAGAAYVDCLVIRPTALPAPVAEGPTSKDVLGGTVFCCTLNTFGIIFVCDCWLDPFAFSSSWKARSSTFSSIFTSCLSASSARCLSCWSFKSACSAARRSSAAFSAASFACWRDASLISYS